MSRTPGLTLARLPLSWIETVFQTEVSVGPSLINTGAAQISLELGQNGWPYSSWSALTLAPQLNPAGTAETVLIQPPAPKGQAMIIRDLLLFVNNTVADATGAFQFQYLPPSAAWGVTLCIPNIPSLFSGSGNIRAMDCKQMFGGRTSIYLPEGYQLVMYTSNRVAAAAQAFITGLVQTIPKDLPPTF